MGEKCDNGLAVLTLNRPKALNAANLGMVKAIREQLASWKADPAVKTVLLQGSGGRAFCSGGDVKGCREALVAGDHQLPKDQLFHEYHLLVEVIQLGKPSVCLQEGVTMGFGLGLACSTQHRWETDSYNVM